MGNGAKNDGAGRGAQTVDNDRLARTAQALIFIHVNANPAAMVLNNQHRRMTGANSCHQEHRRDLSRQELHIQPQFKSVEPESDCLEVMQKR